MSMHLSIYSEHKYRFNAVKANHSGHVWIDIKEIDGPLYVTLHMPVEPDAWEKAQRLAAAVNAILAELAVEVAPSLESLRALDPEFAST